MAFTRRLTVRFDQGDPRGILFYGRVHELAHRVFEDFVVSEVVDRWEDWFLAPAFIVPIKHVEATFNRPMRPGQAYDAELVVSRLGDSSFDVLTRFREADRAADEAVPCAETRTSHVFADAQHLRKLPIPSPLRARLEAHLARE